MMKTRCLILGVCFGVFVSLQVSAQENLVQVMDRFLSSCWTGTSFNESSSESVSAKNWFNGLDKEKQSNLLSVLLERVEKSSEVNENTGFIKAAEEYLLLCQNSDDICGDILEMLGMVYADQRDADGLASARERLTSYAEITGRDYDAAISQLTHASNELLPLSKDLEGIWVSDKVNKNGFPEYIYVVKDNRIVFDDRSEGSIGMTYIWYRLTERAAQLFEVNDQKDQIRFDFFSQKIKGGHEFLAGTMYDFSQATGRANAEYIAQRGVTLGNAIGSTLESALIAGIFEGIGEELAKARSKVYWISNEGTKVSSGHLNVKTEKRIIKSTVDKEDEKVETEIMNLYRVDPQKDHIVFAKGRYEGFELTNATKEDREELERLYKKANTPIVVWGTTMAVVAAGCLTGGIIMMTREGAYNKETRVWNTTGKIGKGLIFGSLVPLTASLMLFAGMKDAVIIPKAYKDFNARQMKKLKAKYGVTITAAPVYDPFTNTTGGAFAMTF